MYVFAAKLVWVWLYQIIDTLKVADGVLYGLLTSTLPDRGVQEAWKNRRDDHMGKE